MRPGEVGTVVEKNLDEGDRAVLRAMGLTKDCTLRMCRAGEPCIVAVLGSGTGDALRGGEGGVCRIGLAKPLAQKIVVQVRSRGGVQG